MTAFQKLPNELYSISTSEKITSPRNVPSVAFTFNALLKYLNILV